MPLANDASPRFLTVPEVTKLFRFNDDQPTRRLIRLGRLPAIRPTGKAYLIPAVAVERMIAEIEARAIAW